MDEFILRSSHTHRFAPSSEPEQTPVDPELAQQIKDIPDKLAFKIGEVAEILDVKAYVLRYWETEFDMLRPKKHRNNQRMYERKDIELLLNIKKLLYKDRFSIEGARAALKKQVKAVQRVKEIGNVTEQMEHIKGLVSGLIGDIQVCRKNLDPSSVESH